MKICKKSLESGENAVEDVPFLLPRIDRLLYLFIDQVVAFLVHSAGRLWLIYLQILKRTLFDYLLIIFIYFLEKLLVQLSFLDLSAVFT